MKPLKGKIFKYDPWPRRTIWIDSYIYFGNCPVDLSCQKQVRDQLSVPVGMVVENVFHRTYSEMSAIIKNNQS